MKVFAFHREVKLAAPNALGGHHLKHEKSGFYDLSKVRIEPQIANIFSYKKQFLLAIKRVIFRKIVHSAEVAANSLPYPIAA
jgi:hypothetical protein